MRLSQLTDSTAILDDPSAMAERYDRDGCLLIRNVLDPATTAELAEQAAAMLHRWTMTDPATRHDTICWNGTPLGNHDLVDLDTIPALTTLIADRNAPAHPMRGVIETICGHPVYLWRNVFFFITTPEEPTHITRPHRDAYAYSPTGDYRRFWIAITDIPFADNGLAVALGSHRTTPTTPNPTTPAPNDHWRTAEFHPGDALILHNNLLHQGLPPTSNRIRIAMAVIASRDTDPRPPAAFTRPECRTRNRRMREIATRLNLTEQQHIQIRRDLLSAGQPITETTVQQALTRQ